MFTTILSAIAAIPALLKAVQDLLGYFKKAEENAWFADRTKVMQDIAKAKTPEEYQKAAKDLQNVIQGL